MAGIRFKNTFINVFVIIINCLKIINTGAECVNVEHLSTRMFVLLRATRR